jgi:RimJ/RimL family protein N-acetyltransferase
VKVEGLRIRGPRLLLRAFRPDEIDAEWQTMRASDKSVVPELPDEAAFKARLSRSGTLAGGWLDLAIELDGQWIGRIQTFVPPGRELRRGTFWIGMGLREEARGQGYGLEALLLLADWLFEHAGAEVLEGATDPGNVAMRTVMRRAGWAAGGPVTEVGREWVSYTLTRQQWQASPRRRRARGGG